MPALVIAIGNPLRGDDGVARRVAELVAHEHIETRRVMQLTPELAAEIARYDSVIFVDASLSSTEVRMESIANRPSVPQLTHVSTPGEIVALSRALFGFSGRAHACHIPVRDLSAGEGLSPRATAFAEQAASAICKIS
ncbi:MAG TPA: hydrogenase maturation protease [Bryobacteraceae bacterium]|nr:hydrogenase maturation protease [Bryobacteraceae bacterium]